MLNTFYQFYYNSPCKNVVNCTILERHNVKHTLSIVLQQPIQKRSQEKLFFYFLTDFLSRNVQAEKSFSWKEALLCYFSGHHKTRMASSRKGWGRWCSDCATGPTNSGHAIPRQPLRWKAFLRFHGLFMQICFLKSHKRICFKGVWREKV